MPTFKTTIPIVPKADSPEPKPTQFLSISLNQHIDDFPGDWRRAIPAVALSECPEDAAVLQGVFEDRGHPEFTIRLPSEVPGETAIALRERVTNACDDFIRATVQQAAVREVQRTLPKPEPGMSPNDKGKLLLRYLRFGVPVAGLDFSEADVTKADLAKANLLRADLRGARMAHVNLREACLSHANLSGATLGGSILTRVDGDCVNLHQAVLVGADLTGAGLDEANLTEALLQDAVIEAASLHLANLDACVLIGARGTPADVRQARISSGTYRLSGWQVSELLDWRNAGASIMDPESFPVEVQQWFRSEPIGITLLFSRTLDFMSKTLVESLLASILGDECLNCQSAYETTQSGGALVRLSGLPVEQLVRIGDRLSEFFNRSPRAEVIAAIEGAVPLAVDEAIQRNITDVVARSVAPMAVLQAQLGERIIDHIDGVYAQVERTEIRLTNEVVVALGKLELEIIESKLDRSGWAWDAAAGKLVRSGGWAVGTGAAGNALWAFFQWISSMV